MQAQITAFVIKYRIPLLIGALVLAIVIAIYMFGRKAGEHSSTSIDLPDTPFDLNDEAPSSTLNSPQYAKNLREVWGGDQAWWMPVSTDDFIQGCDLLLSLRNKNEWIAVSNDYNRLYEKKKYPTIRSLLAANDYPVTVSNTAKTKADSVLNKLDQFGL